MPVASIAHPAHVPILGVHVDRVTMAEAMEFIELFVRVGGAHHVITLDSSMCVLASQDEDLDHIIAEADLVTPDSAGVLWACRRSGNGLPERVSGVEIVERMCATSAQKGLRLFFLGAAPGVAQAAADRMMLRYPGCEVVGTQHGYFSADDEPEVLERIREAAPDVLCVAMGIPKQEKWIARHRDDLGVSVLIGVGGTLDVLSGTIQRAPAWVQRANLEWLYRLAKDPRKLKKVLVLPKFVMMNLRWAQRGARPMPRID